MKSTNTAEVKLPDIRTTTAYISASNIKDQIAALLYAAGLVNDNEHVVDIDFGPLTDAIAFKGDPAKVIPVTFKHKKEKEVFIKNYHG